MFGKKQKFDLNEYIEAISFFAESAYKSCEKAIESLDIKDKESLMRALDYTRLYFISDLMVAWLELDDDRYLLQKKIFGKFYSVYPEDFLKSLSDAIQSDDTKLGDVCNFLVKNFSDGALERLECLTFISNDLTTSLQLFASFLRATKRKDGYYIVNYSKLSKDKSSFSDNVKKIHNISSHIKKVLLSLLIFICITSIIVTHFIRIDYIQQKNWITFEPDELTSAQIIDKYKNEKIYFDYCRIIDVYYDGNDKYIKLYHYSNDVLLVLKIKNHLYSKVDEINLDKYCTPVFFLKDMYPINIPHLTTNINVDVFIRNDWWDDDHDMRDSVHARFDTKIITGELYDIWLT